MGIEQYLRNPEIRRGLLIQALLAALVTAVGFVLSPSHGWLAPGTAALFIALYHILTYRRYRRIAELSQEIDRILHGGEDIRLDAYAEGELAILQSEILKLTVQLREQADALRRDKIYLADSIADISHQIRTPLTSINLLRERLSRPGLAEEQRASLLREMESLLVRIDWLISVLLKIARLDAGTVSLQSQPVPVAELIRRAAATLAVPMDLRGQQLQVCASGGETFTGDLSWSVEALANILKNCMEATPEGGWIRIEAAENPLYTEIVVRDSGPGIDPEDLPHLFKRFYKGKHSGDQSVGIGLALARMIVTRQNGTLQAGNHPEGGAKFTIRFYKSIV